MSIMEESYSKKSINSNSYDDGEDSLESLLSCKSVNIFTDQEGIEKVWKLIIEQNEMKKDAEFSINGMGEQITELQGLGDELFKFKELCVGMVAKAQEDLK